MVFSCKWYTTPVYLRTDDNQTIDPIHIPNAFNKYFTELGEKLPSEIPPSNMIPENYFADFKCPTNTLSCFKDLSDIDVLRLLRI